MSEMSMCFVYALRQVDSCPTFYPKIPFFILCTTYNSCIEKTTTTTRNRLIEFFYWYWHPSVTSDNGHASPLRRINNFYQSSY